MLRRPFTEQFDEVGCMHGYWRNVLTAIDMFSQNYRVRKVF